MPSCSLLALWSVGYSLQLVKFLGYENKQGLGATAKMINILHCHPQKQPNLANSSTFLHCEKYFTLPKSAAVLLNTRFFSVSEGH